MSELYDYWTSGKGLDAMTRDEQTRREHLRRVGLELAEIVRLAQEFDLPLPLEPTRMVDGAIVHPTVGPGLATWTACTPAKDRLYST